MHLKSLTLKYPSHAKRWGWIAAICLATSTTLSGLDLDPILVGAWPPHPSGWAYVIQVREHTAYVVGRRDWAAGRLWVFDVTDRTDPQLQGSCVLPDMLIGNGLPESVAVAGNHAYVAMRSGLQIVDVTDSANPVYLRPYAGDCRGAAVVGNYAYVSIYREDAAGSWNRYIDIVDVSNPTAPGLVGTCRINVWTQRLVVAGHHVYAAAGSVLQIIDVSQPTQPRSVGEIVGNAEDVAVSGHHAYVAAGSQGLRVIDISNPANPVSVATHAITGTSKRMAVAGNVVCVALEEGGLQVIDVSNPAQPQGLVRYDRYEAVEGLMLEDTWAYLADSKDGLQILDISHPAQPEPVSGYQLDHGYAEDVVLSGNHAYVAAGGSGLWVIDVSRPDRPWRVGQLDTTGYAQSVFVQGQHAYLAQAHYGSGLHDALVVIDVADPANPRQVGSFSRWGSSNDFDHDVQVVGDFAYLADGAQGLQIIDITDPTRPEGVATVPTGGRVRGLAVAGDYVYLASIANMNYQLITIKISPPTQPQWMGAHPLAAGADMTWPCLVTMLTWPVPFSI
jgi:hypothetical protein